MSPVRFGGGLFGLALLFAPLLGCVSFSEQDYCAASPQHCELRVTALKPAYGPSAGGTKVILTGQALEADTQLEVDGVPAVTHFTSATSLTFVSPPSTPGAKDITLRSKVKTVTLPGAFTYDPAPRLAGVSPSNGSSIGGDTLTVTGAGLTPDTVLRIGGIAVHTQSFEGIDQLIATAPALASGTYDVEVSNAYGSDVLPRAYTTHGPWFDANEGLFAGVSAVAASPEDPDVVYAAIPGYGIFKTTPTQQLSKVYDGYNSLADSDVVTGMAMASALSGPQALATTRGIYTYGNPWLMSPAGNRFLEAVVIDPQGSIWVARAGPDGVLSYERQANTFTPRSSGLPASGAHALAATSSALYAATDSGVYRMAAYAGAWTLAGLPGVALSRVAVAPGSPDVVYAVGPAGLYRSVAGSTDWPLIRPGPLQTLAVQADPPQFVAIAPTEGGLLLSLDAGATWDSQPELASSHVTALDILPSGFIAAGTREGSVFTSSSARGFQRYGERLLAKVGSLLAVSGPTPRVYACSPGALFQSHDSGATWQATPFVDVPGPWQVAVDRSNPDIVYAATPQGVRRSRDGGSTWTAVGSLTDVRAVAVGAAGTQTIYAELGTYAVYRSPDGGDTWSQLINAPTLPLYGLSIPYGLRATNSVSPEILYMYQAAPDGTLQVTEYKLTVSGMGLTRANEYLAGAFDLQPASDTLYLSLVYPGVVRGQVDSSWDWQPVADGTTWLSVGERPGELLGYSDQQGLLKLGDKGWVRIGPGLPDKKVLAAAFDPAVPGVLYAATATRGIQKSTTGGQ